MLGNSFRGIAAMGVGAAAAGAAITSGNIFGASGAYFNGQKKFLDTVPEFDISGTNSAARRKEADRQTILAEMRRNLSSLSPLSPNNMFYNGRLFVDPSWSRNARDAMARYQADRYDQGPNWVPSVQRALHRNASGVRNVGTRAGALAGRMDRWRQDLDPSSRQRGWDTHLATIARATSHLAQKADEKPEFDLHLHLSPASQFMAQVTEARVAAAHRSLARLGM